MSQNVGGKFGLVVTSVFIILLFHLMLPLHEVFDTDNVAYFIKVIPIHLLVSTSTARL